MEFDLSRERLARLKVEAKQLREHRLQQNIETTHSEALEILAASYGLRDWNTLHAKASQPVDLRAGDSLQGRYLGQSFTGTVLDIANTAEPDQALVTIKFDDPVDVVKFDSFSSYRSRISKKITRTGYSLDKTSDGEPHLVLM